jgi:hypothetical protein
MQLLKFSIAALFSVTLLACAASAPAGAEPTDHASPHYNNIPADTQKVFLEIADGDHFVANNSAKTLYGLIGSYAIAWLKLYMEGDERYRDFIYGDACSRNVAAFSRYEMNP